MCYNGIKLTDFTYGSSETQPSNAYNVNDLDLFNLTFVLYHSC